MPSHHKCAVKNCQDRVSVRHRFPNPRKCMTIFKLWMNCIGNKILQHLDPIYSSIEQIVDQLPTAAMPPTQPVVEMPLIATTPTTAQQNSNQVEQIEKQSSNPSSSRSGSGFLSYVSVSRESHLSPRAKRLYRVANRLSRANRRLKARRLFQRTRVSNSELLNEALQNLDSCVATFIKSQISLAGRKSQGRRYNLEEKLMGLILYKQSGKGYKALSKFFALPGRKTIRQLLHKIPINPGLNEVIFNNLTEVAAGLDEIVNIAA
nr:unnamed protein product [Callosobruchus chinensis]